MPSADNQAVPAHGDPKRFRTAEISNWSGKAVAAPRIDFDALLDPKHANVRFFCPQQAARGRTWKSLLPESGR